MAKKKPEPESKSEKSEAWWTTPKGRLSRLREVFPKDAEFDQTNRSNFIEDMKFIHEPGAQWDEYTKAKRSINGKEVRPMYQDNRLRVTIKRIVNNMRANPAAGKVRPFEDGDKDLADIREGLIRAIANQSNFDNIRDAAAEYQVAGGYAAWGVEAAYADDSVDAQDLKIRQLRNPLCLYCDRFATDMTGRDAGHWTLIDHISEDAYEKKYPNKDVVDFESEFEDDDEWNSEGKVRIAEFWYRVPVEKTLHLLSDGKTIDDSELTKAKARGLQVLKSRTIQCYDIYSAIYSGEAELSKPQKWAGKYFPWVRIYGEYVVIDGKVQWYGAVRHAKDAQRGFNLMMTSAVEAVASQPVNQVWATAKQGEGLAQHWADAANKNLPFQLYNADPAAPGPPQRVGAPEVPVAMMQLAGFMGESIKADTGIFDASLGQQGNETSGKAINARQIQGEIATFNFPSNMAAGIKRTWEIINDAVPYYYDTPRSLRILGADDSDKYVKVNEPAPDGSTLNDLSVGKFDIVMTVGPSFSTKRQEAVEAYSQMAQGNPELMQVAGDLIMKGMDLPYADEIAERIKLVLPKPIQDAINKDAKLPPEVMAAMAQVDQAMQQVQQQGQLVQQAAQEAQGEKAQADKAKADVQIAIANLKIEAAQLETQKAQFETLVANAKTELAGMQATAEEQAQAGENAQAEGEQAATGALAAIQQAAEAFKAEAQAFLEQAAQVVAASTQTPIVVQKSGPKQVRMKRVNGELVGEMVEADGTVKQVKASRDSSGELTGTIQ